MVEHKSSGCQKPEKSLTFVKNRGKCGSQLGEFRNAFPIPRIPRAIFQRGDVIG
jgi:hypothetical protein